MAVEILEPMIRITDSVVIDVAEYVENTNNFVDVNKNAGNGSALCGCIFCKDLEKLLVVDAAEVSDTVKKFTGVASKVAMSIQVDEPGFIEIKTLKDNIPGISHVFFPVAGKFSLVSIYKNLRSKVGKSLWGVDAEHKNTVAKELECAMPFDGGESNLLSEVIASITGDKEIKVEFDKHFAYLNRFIPIISRKHSSYSFDPTLNLVTLDGIPGIPTKESGVNFLREKVKGLKSAFSSYSDFVVAAFDKVKMEIVISPDIDNFIWNDIKARPDQYNGVIDTIDLVKALPSPSAFVEKINLHMKKMGAGDFEVTDVRPVGHKMCYHKYNYEDEETEVISEKVKCFKANISFKDAPLIGTDGSRGGEVFLRTNDDLTKFTLVQSSWCQRISSWSKYKTGVVDQHYNIWDIADWLSGPFAEKFSLVQSKAKLVFSGNTPDTKKKDILNNLRNKLAKKM